MTMEMPELAIRVEATSYTGTRDGVPRLLELFGRFGVSATFYFAMGPDNSGQGVRRLFTRPGYLKRLLRLRRVRPISARLLFSGTLIPAPIIGARLPELLRQTEARGHEVGIHAWDHARWYDLLPWLPKQVTLLEMGRASALFEEIMGRRARTTAAPGWAVTTDSLEIQDALGLTYCSDTRGSAPFYPVLGGRRFSTLQVPTTLPTMDELLMTGVSQNDLAGEYPALIRPGWNVLTVRAELEGLGLEGALAELLRRLHARGVRFHTLGELAASARSTAGEAAVVTGNVPGCPGGVALQRAS